MINYVDAANAYNNVTSAVRSFQGAVEPELNNKEETISFVDFLKRNIVADEPVNKTTNTVISDAVKSVKDTSKQAEFAIRSSLMSDGALSKLVTALSEAEIKLQFMIAARDKVIAAYQDIIKMPI